MQRKFSGRRKPYTQIGIRRKKCCHCGARAEYQWNCCANGNWWLPLCTKCDIAINKIMLRFARITNATELLAAYRKKAYPKESA